MDESDGDIASFFYYMGFAAKRAAPRRKKPLPLLTPEFREGLSTFTRRYFQDLFGRLKPPAVLVLDNYQEVPAESAFHDVIRDGLAEIPPQTNVLILSRHAPPASLARFRANDQMELIGWKDLILTTEEANDLVRLRGEGRSPALPGRARLPSPPPICRAATYPPSGIRWMRATAILPAFSTTWGLRPSGPRREERSPCRC